MVSRLLWFDGIVGSARWLLWLSLALGTLCPTSLHARPMIDDPEGFQGLPWGSRLTEQPDLVLTNTWQTVTEFSYKNGLPKVGEARVDSITLTSVDGQFARVTVRYQGKTTHNKIKDYMEFRFGKIELMPGAMVRGLNQQFNWRGPETEINLTYQGMGERGFIFIESRTLAPAFSTDSGSGHTY